MKSPAFVLFDMDGVLIDSEPHHAKAECRIASELSAGRLSGPGFDTTGTSTLGVYQTMLARLELSLDPAVLVARHFQDTFSSIRAAHEPPMPGLLPLLDALDDADIPYAVVSSSDRSYVENVLHYLNVFNRFRFAVCGCEAVRLKPAPEPYRKALALAKILPEDAVVIEDSSSGVRAANAAGIFSIGFDRHVGQDLSHACLRIAALTELIPLLALGTG